MPARIVITNTTWLPGVPAGVRVFPLTQEDWERAQRQHGAAMRSLPARGWAWLVDQPGYERLVATGRTTVKVSNEIFDRLWPVV